jgi:hypothetical protein
VLGEFLALAVTKDHGLDAVILVKRSAQDAVRRWLSFFGEVEDMGVGDDGSLAPPIQVVVG